jgi:hypothetical protein
MTASLLINSVIPNRGAVKSCHGCRQILNLQYFIDGLLIRVPQAAILYRVPQNFFGPLGCREHKKKEG